MEEREIALVRESWALVKPIADDAMAMFYSNLFELDRNIARLFAGKDMSVQRARLADALDLIIRNLDQHGVLAGQLQEIGARHAGYGALEGDFATVGKALILTLEKGLPGIWTDDHKRSWTAAYTFIAAQMLTGHRAQHAA